MNPREDDRGDIYWRPANYVADVEEEPAAAPAPPPADPSAPPPDAANPPPADPPENEDA